MPKPRTIYDIEREFQQRLLRQERRAASQMVRTYQTAWKQLRKQIEGLQAEYDKAIAEGETVSQNWYYRSQRAREIERQIARELDKFSTWSEKLVSQEQKRIIEETLKHTDDMMILGIDERALRLNIMFNRINPRAIEAIVGTTSQNSPLFRLFRSLASEGSQSAINALRNGIALGYNPRKTARLVREALGTSLNRALTIARTETLRAQRIAANENYRANDNIVKGWRWSADVNSDRTCPACFAMHGTEHPLSENMESHPSCRCAAVSITFTYEELYERWGLNPDDGKRLDLIDNREAVYKKYNISNDKLRQFMNGEDAFKSLSPEEQRSILGNTRWLAWKDGKLEFSNFVKTTYSPEYGRGIALPSLQETLGSEMKQEYRELARWHVNNGWENTP